MRRMTALMLMWLGGESRFKYILVLPANIVAPKELNNQQRRLRSKDEYQG